MVHGTAEGDGVNIRNPETVTYEILCDMFLDMAPFVQAVYFFQKRADLLDELWNRTIRLHNFPADWKRPKVNGE